MRIRISIIGYIFTAVMAIICIKAIDVQVFKSKWLSQKASKSQRVVTETIGKRGTIYDKNNKAIMMKPFDSF